MKNRTFLFLMEQAIMLLVFALAAALCLRVFLWADIRSRDNAAAGSACAAAQNAAELVQHFGGDLSAAAEILGGTLEDGRWTLPSGGGWTVSVQMAPTEVPCLGRAQITIRQGEQIYDTLTVSYQRGGFP